MEKGQRYGNVQKALMVVLALVFAAGGARAQGAEVEPNHPCESAQSLGTVSPTPITVSGALDTPPDIDFYRFSSTPGETITVTVQGSITGQGTLDDPHAAVFSACGSILDYGRDYHGADDRLEFVAPGHEFIVAVTSYGDFDFTGNGFYSGSYVLTARQETPAESISGRIVGSDTGSGLSSTVMLYSCYFGSCSNYLGEVYTGVSGQFRFESGVYPLFFALLPGEYMIRIQPFNIAYQQVEVGPFPLAGEQALDLGDLSITPVPAQNSIRGRLVDAATGTPLPGEAVPFSQVQLVHCRSAFFCFTVRTARPDAQGRFRFEGSQVSLLRAGTYYLRAYADQYEPTEGPRFTLGDLQHLDTGDLGVRSLPVRVFLEQGCGPIPLAGGECRFTARITNGTTSALDAAAWTMVSDSSPTRSVSFQTANPKPVSLKALESKVVEFSVFVPASVPRAGYLCAAAYVARKPHEIETIGYNSLFCINKGAQSFSVVPDRDERDALRRSQGER